MSDTSTTGVDSRVELRLPADGAYVSVLRTLTAGLAARLDFTLDDIEDLRIAVSEAVAMVLDQADRQAQLTCTCELHPARLDVTISAPAHAAADPDYESFGWQVLTTLTTEADVATSEETYAVHLVVASTLEPAVA